MAPQVLVNGSLLVDEAARNSAAAFIDRAHDRNVATGTLTLDDGTELQLDQNLAELLQFVIRGLPTGSVSVRSIPAELTSTTAASILGVSRPTLMKMVREGALPSHRVGAHHRFKNDDVRDFVEARRVKRVEAFVHLRELDEAAEMSE